MRERKVIGTYEGVEISEYWNGDVLWEVEYNIFEQDSYLNYEYVEGQVSIEPSKVDDFHGQTVFEEFKPTLDQLLVIHNHLLVKVLPTWREYDLRIN